jgi:hypothetical protein
MSRVGHHASRVSRLAATRVGETEATHTSGALSAGAGPRSSPLASTLPALSAAWGPLLTSGGQTRSRASGQAALRPAGADARWISCTPFCRAILPDPGTDAPQCGLPAQSNL